MAGLEIEIFTTDHAIRGLLETQGERLSDILNDSKVSSILLSDAYMIRLYNAGSTAPAKVVEASISKDHILFARPVQQDLTHKSLFRRATRQVYQVAINLPGFEVQGMIHMTDRLNVTRVLVERPENFIPITHARALYMFNPRLEVKSSVFVVNKYQITMLAEIDMEKLQSSAPSS